MSMKLGKTQLKGLIKECIKEVIFEEGFLSGIISEVVVGMNKAPLVEQKVETKSKKRPPLKKETSKRLNETRERLLSAMGEDAYGGVNLFEGTTPLTTGQASGGPSTGPLGNVDPGDAGVDISAIPGSSAWKQLIK
tara:strand:- start:25 stop:432 length:408 start_codon:yes stop_codon:yes gene_type:complete